MKFIRNIFRYLINAVLGAEVTLNNSSTISKFKYICISKIPTKSILLSIQYIIRIFYRHTLHIKSIKYPRHRLNSFTYSNYLNLNPLSVHLKYLLNFLNMILKGCANKTTVFSKDNILEAS